jgi:hypothetical protein
MGPKEKEEENFSCALVTLLDFLPLEYRTDGLSCHIGKELPLNASKYLRRAEISHDDFAVQALVQLHTVRFRAIGFGTSYMNIFKHLI